MPWNPENYHQFQTLRAAPFEDLLQIIAVRPGLRVIDLGCGSGTITARLADHLPDSDVLGIDSSPEMLAYAHTLARPGLRFEQADLATLTGHWDLVFSHAALQWVPDHAALLPRLLAKVAPGGQFVAQLASDHDHPARVLLRETASESPFREALDGWTRPNYVLPLREYAEILFRYGTITIFEKLYPVLLPDANAAIAWYKGTSLIPYLDRLPDTLRAPFLERFRAKLVARWPEGFIFYSGSRIVLAVEVPA